MVKLGCSVLTVLGAGNLEHDDNCNQCECNEESLPD